MGVGDVKAIVTGGAGLVGSHIVDMLVERGDEAVVIDNLDPVTHPNGKPPAWMHDTDVVPFWVRDVSDNITAAMFKDVEVVFHQAAYGGFTDEHEKMTKVNCLGTARVMRLAAEAGARKVVVASSQAVYGGGRYADCGSHGGRHQWLRRPADMDYGVWGHPCQACSEPHEPVPLAENHPTHVLTTYAQTKLFAERLALRLGVEYRIPVVALRYALTYGPRQSLTNPYTGVCSQFATAIRDEKPCRVYEDGLQTRDFTFVEDVARANLLVADSEATNHMVSLGPSGDKRQGQVFVVGTGVATSVLDFIGHLGGALGKEPIVEMNGEWRHGDARHLVTDPARLRSLGWEPRVPVADGVRRYVEWFTA